MSRRVCESTPHMKMFLIGWRRGGHESMARRGRPLLAAARGLVAVAMLLLSPATAIAQDAVAALVEQARQQYNAGRHADAFATYDRAIDLIVRTRGPSDRQIADVLAAKGVALAMIGRREEARAATLRAIAVVEQARGPRSRDALLTRVLLGGMHVNFGEIDEAKAVYAKAVADARAWFGDTDTGTLQVIQVAAQAALRWGDAAEAVRLRRIVLAGWEKSRGADTMDTIAARSNLAHALVAAGDVAGAEQAFGETLRSLERLGMKDTAESAAVLSNLGTMLSQRGEHAKALAALEAALATYERTEGRDAANVNTIRSNVAGVKMELGRTDEALADYREIVTSMERTAGPDDPRTLTVVNNLANVLVRAQRAAEAVPLLERVAAGLRRAVPETDPRVLSADANVAAAYRLVGRGADAVRLGAATVAGRELLLPPGHTDVGDALGNLADALMLTGDAARAVEMTDRQQRGDRLRDARILPALTDAEQATFLGTHTVPELEQAINVALQAHGVPDAAERSASWVANAKGRGVEATAARMRLARAARDPLNARRIGEVVAVRRQMAALVQVAPQPGGAEQVRTQLATLEDRERTLVRELGLATAADAAPAWIDIREIRAGIPRGAVLVDVVRFTRIDFTVPASGRRLHESRYVAWIVPAAGAGEVTVVDLGDADAIDAAVAAYREAVSGDSREDAISRLGEAEVTERLDHDRARPLANLVLAPVLAAIAGGGGPPRADDGVAPGVEEIVICPDGALWLVPWAALPTADGSYLVERCAVRFVTAARDLVRDEPDAPARPAGAAQSRPLVFAAADFDLGPGDLATRLARIGGGASGPAGKPATPALADASRSAALALPKVSPLPGTRTEIAAIAAPLEALTGTPPEIFLGGDAQETVLKHKAVHPRVLVLATHGYFLETDAGRDPQRSAAIDPLLRCGLLLAGANTATVDRPPTLDDGVLTGLEITGLDLAGTELVVLSACDTGVGEVRGGEGVAGLRRAFQAAGARSVVATLWRIPDAESAWIMAAFYENLATNRSASRALRDAQVEFIRQRRENRSIAAAHPYFWAAYGITGW